MHGNEQSPNSLLRKALLAVMTASSIAAAMPLVWAQNSAPPTAVEAARMPQYAARLAAHRAQARAAGNASQPRTLYENRQSARGRAGSPLDQGVIYENGPINGNTNAWTISFGLIVADSFSVANNDTQVTGASFGMWLWPGDTLQSAELAITSSPFGGTSYFDQTVNFTQSGCVVNNYGYDVCTVATTFTGPPLNSGTYWVNLLNAVTAEGESPYWDENSGAGCQSQGCPSLADQNQVGTIPSESFTILGSATTSTSTGSDYACPSPQPGFRDLYDFSDRAPSGVGLGAAGNLYGTLATAGRYGAGLIYELGQRAGHWLYSSLYSFLGDGNGSAPDGVIVGPEGILYGAANGGIQNCGASYCGLIYQVRPSPTPCITALCSWDKTTIYQFTGNTDAAGGTVTAFDSAGNLYGVSAGAGAYGAGAVFELTPSSGGWTEKILYSFTGGSDGGSPNSLLVGHDGNLYGTTVSGGIQDYCDGDYQWCGVVFQLAPSGGGWTENVIHTFTGTDVDGWGPYGLIQDRQGNLYGLSVCYASYFGGCADDSSEVAGVIFGLMRSSGEWEFNIIHTYAWQECQLSGNVTYHALTMDAAENLYATEGGANWGLDELFWCGAVLNVGTGTTLVTGAADIFGNLTSDASGNLYGTTNTCGFGTPSRTSGMVWQYSP